MSEPIYLDYAAATPLNPRVLEAMLPYFSDNFYNPSAQYTASRKVHQEIDNARKCVATCIGARPSEIIFTAGGTESNNAAIFGLMSQYLESNMIVSAIEHESVLAPAAQYQTKIAKVDSLGFVSVDEIQSLIDDKTVLISVMYANNEIGTIQPIKDIAAIIKIELERRKQTDNKLPLYLHTDACQAANYLDLHWSRLGVDMMTINGGKIYGPKQSAILFVKSGIQLNPLIKGGGQEYGQRSGTENVPGVMGFTTALELVQKKRYEEVSRLQLLQQLFMKRINEIAPNTTINGSMKSRLPNNVHISFPGKDNERLMMSLDEHGIQCAVGSACSASNDESSHVLRAIGLSDDEARTSLRFTMGQSTDESAIERTITAIKACL